MKITSTGPDDPFVNLPNDEGFRVYMDANWNPAAPAVAVFFREFRSDGSSYTGAVKRLPPRMLIAMAAPDEVGSLQTTVKMWEAIKGRKATPGEIANLKKARAKNPLPKKNEDSNGILKLSPEGSRPPEDQPVRPSAVPSALGD